MKNSTKVIIVIILVLAVAGAVFYAMKVQAVANNIGQVVRIENPQRGELIEFVSAPGEIEPKTKVELSAKVTSRVTEIPFDEGQNVKKGVIWSAKKIFSILMI